MGSQMGKTEGVFNVIGARLDDDPTPTLYIGPTQKLVQSMSSDRIMKMFRSVPSLWDKLEKGKRNKIDEKWIAGVRFGFGWAGSATELAGHPAGIVLVDERDRMDDNSAGEGDPVELAEARTATYPDGKVIVVSTPTLGTVDVETDAETGIERFKPSDTVDSPIWKLWQEGTRSEWAWPCPDCGDYFIPRFRHLWWPKGCTPHQAIKAARLVCPHCGSMIEDAAKQKMNAAGVYLSPGQRVGPDGVVQGAAPATDVASFWVSGLCSPWRSFGQRARSFLAAVESGDQTRVQTVLNTGFGELFAMRGEAPDWTAVAQLRKPYEAGVIPEGVQLLTCAVDVQGNRLVYSIRGWGFNYESWLIENGEIWGETQHDAVWMQASALLDREFGGMKIVRMMVDAGFKPGEARDDHQVYLFARRHMGRVLATKGHDKLERPFKASKIDVSYRGKVIPNGLDLWHFDSDFFKTWVHGRLNWPDDQPGGFHLHQTTSEDYCQQLVAEQRVTRPSGQVTWVRVKRDNHYLDCEALNALAAHIVGVHSLPKDKPEPVPAPRASRARMISTGMR